MHYYNEFDPKAAAWLRELILARLIPDGFIDTRSIVEVQPQDLQGFTSCHLFAGIGGWPYALRLAGWPDDLPVWTASCPCQPFSCAGKLKRSRDKRHLWPEAKRLITHGAAPVVFGEQVASKAGRLWLSRVRADLEALAYAVGSADLCAAGVSAPHIRQRLYWVADSTSSKRWSPAEGGLDVSHGSDSGWKKTNSGRAICSEKIIRVGEPNSAGREEGIKTPTAARHGGSFVSTNRHYSRLVNADGYHSHWWSGPLQVGRNCCEAEIERGGRKYRAQWRTKPGVPLLANGVPGRVAQLCGFGNAIVPQLAAEFIQSYLETLG